mmetsp:Transcript_119215/g.344846  ORF Transcript_119215/g.344846 Transcript_119215/m.344846 type:complete len:238 (+) Transcript_119215:543-1256(+)
MVGGEDVLAGHVHRGGDYREYVVARHQRGRRPGLDRLGSSRHPFRHHLSLRGPHKVVHVWRSGLLLRPRSHYEFVRAVDRRTCDHRDQLEDRIRGGGRTEEWRGPRVVAQGVPALPRHPRHASHEVGHLHRVEDHDPGHYRGLANTWLVHRLDHFACLLGELDLARNLGVGRGRRRDWSGILPFRAHRLFHGLPLHRRGRVCRRWRAADLRPRHRKLWLDIRFHLLRYRRVHVFRPI